MIQGEIIYLTAVEYSDLFTLLNWRNLPSFRQYFREHRELSEQQHLKWFESTQNSDWATEYPFAIKFNQNHELIGYASVNHINWINRNGQISLFIGKDHLYIDSFGWAIETVKLIHEFAFEVLNLTKLFVELYSNDRHKIDLFTKLGYIEEARLKNHIFKNGLVLDSYIFSFFRVGNL